MPVIASQAECALIKRVSIAERSALLIFGLSAAALLAFAELADEVIEGDTRAFDEFILLAFRSSADLTNPLGPEWLEEMMRDFTALGSIAVLTLITLTVVGYLMLYRKRRVAFMVAGAVVSGVLLSSLLKWGFSRSRPDLVPHITTVYTQSFPSGHAMLSAVVYLTLGVLLARTQNNPQVKIYLLTVAGLATMLVGISRIYLGVHWPTDVLAGWAVGAGWSLLCWLLMLWLQGHNRIEPEAGADGAPPEVRR
jgi:undecaprenyl-diphosphatase